MRGVSYLNFDLWVGRDQDGYVVRVIEHPAGGDAQHTFVLPFDQQQIRRLLNPSANGGPTRGEAEAPAMPEQQREALIEQFGSQLYAAVFGPPVQECLVLSLSEAGRQGADLRLRLLLGEVPELAELPWEYLYDQSRQRFLGLTKKTTLVRYLDTPEPLTPLRVSPPLRVLVLIASPSDLPPLKADDEWQRVKAAMGDLEAQGLVVIERLAQATTAALRAALRDHEYHVFHFVGHGHYDERSGESLLMFEDSDGYAAEISGATLARRLCDHATLRMAVLNACEGGRASATNPYAGVAQRLVLDGLSAVVAMQAEISDGAARVLAQEFYKALADGLSVDGALADARQAMEEDGHAVEWGTPVLYMRARDGRVFDLERVEPAPTPGTARIFISYKRDVQPDEPLANELADAFEQAAQQVFLDTRMRIGVEWASEIERQIRDCDYMIVLLSAASARSEMVAREVSYAADVFRTSGKAQLLPVRIGPELGLLPYQLSFHLDRLQYARWVSAADTTRLVGQLLRSVSGDRPLPTAPAAIAPQPPVDDQQPNPYADMRPLAGLDDPSEPVRLASRFYIRREADEQLGRLLGRTATPTAGEHDRTDGVTVTIRSPNQTGKSSLLLRGCVAAREQGKRIALLDLLTLDAESIKSLDALLRALACTLIETLGLDAGLVEQAWHGSFTAPDKLKELMQRHILPAATGGLVLAIDEADRLLGSPIADDFFRLLRSWHNRRADELNPYNHLWQRLDLLLVISTEPHLLIKNRNESPFNVGERIEPRDFTAAQVAELNSHYDNPLDAAHLPALHALLGGHPYLTRRALYWLASEQKGWNDLAREAASDRGPFGDHLRRYLWMLRDKPDLQDALLHVVGTHQAPSEELFYRLSRVGLIQGDAHIACAPRCTLYADYFLRTLDGTPPPPVVAAAQPEKDPLVPPTPVARQGADEYQDYGPLDPRSPFYVLRPADEELPRRLLAGEFCYVLTCRQMGKTSLMFRTAERLAAEGVRAATVDLSLIGVAGITPEQWYLSLIDLLRSELRLTSVDVRRWWQERAAFGAVQRFGDFLRQVVLAEIPGRVVVFIDEIDSTLALAFADDFFAAIRATYNSRPRDPAYHRLTFALLGVATPGDLIKDRSRTPFNIGAAIDLQDLELTQAAPLREGLERRFPGEGDRVLAGVFDWTSGHPALTQKLCRAIVQAPKRRWTDPQIDELVGSLFLAKDAGEQSLEFIEKQIEHRTKAQRRELLGLYKQVYSGKAVARDERSLPQNELRLVGLVRARGEQLEVRNRIYQEAFGASWIAAHTPRNLLPLIVAAAVVVALLFAGGGAWYLQQQQRQALATAIERQAQFCAATSKEEALRLFQQSRSPEAGVALFRDLDVTMVPQTLEPVTSCLAGGAPPAYWQGEGRALGQSMCCALARFDATKMPALATRLGTPCTCEGQ